MSLALFLLLSALAIAASVAAIRRVRRDGLRGALSVFAVVAAAPILLCIGAATAYALDEWRLARFSAQLLEAPLPRNTRELARTAAVGVLDGNGDHCDFVVTRALTSSLPLDSLQAHFASITLRPAISGGADGGLPRLDVRADSLAHFTVTAIDAPYPGIFDPRCY